MPGPCEPHLAELYDEHADALFAFLLNLTRNQADCRDLLQEIFLKLARHPDLWSNVRHPRAFLLRLAHRAAIDAWRRQRTRQLHLERTPTEPQNYFAHSPDPDEAAFRQALSLALAELPTDQRAVVHLKLWENQTFAAIAETLEIPINTAASRYRYGLDKLRELLRPLYNELQ